MSYEDITPKKKKKHDVVLKVGAWYPGDIAVGPIDLGNLLGDLRYDALAKYLHALADKLEDDSANDGGRGRGQLSTALYLAAQYVRNSATEIETAWGICEPYMKDEK